MTIHSLIVICSACPIDSLTKLTKIAALIKQMANNKFVAINFINIFFGIKTTHFVNSKNSILIRFSSPKLGLKFYNHKRGNLILAIISGADFRPTMEDLMYQI